ncbi:glycosyltransferase [Streptococcus orisratti]|uniref:glycosyltransferase n=1 Tax=Streptococcus orisratti TaxID=114652 RepID=UPI003D01DC2C
MDKSRISVALTTYNGSEFIIELLDTLRLQKRVPDEVIIGDDCSTDNTVEIVKNYIKKYSLSSWTIYSNVQNLGWQENFKEVISKTTGDYVFLADQDDLWHPDKIDRFMTCFDETNGWMVISDFKTVGDGKSRKTVSMPEIKYSFENNNKKVSFNNNFGAVLRPGCVMAFNAKLKDYYLQLWSENQPHDALLWLIASITNNIYYIDFQSIDFRRTNNNASGSIAHDVRFKKSAIIRNLNVIEWYLKSEYINNYYLERIQQSYQWNNYRKELIINHKFYFWFKLFKYRKCYMSYKQYFGDIYYFLVSKKNN